MEKKKYSVENLTSFLTDCASKISLATKEEWTQWVNDIKGKLDMNQRKKIEVELPEPPPSGGFAACPSGDNEYEDAVDKWHEKVNGMILKAVPKGYSLKSSEIKETKTVRHFAVIEVERR